MRSDEREPDLEQETHTPAVAWDDQALESPAAAAWPFRSWLPYLLLAGLLLVGGLVTLQLLRGPGPTEPGVTPLAYKPDDLMNNLENRLSYLQARTSNVNFYIHTIRRRENLWRLASRRHYSVHSILGCNPQMQTYNVDIGQRVLIPSRAGTLHVVQPNDTVKKVAARYKTSVTDIEKYNLCTQRMIPGEMIFVPDRRPDMTLMNDKMREKYEMRALFVSPLGGRLSSTFGTRRHPVTGKRSLHGGIDIAVRQGTWVGAAADGVVTVASTGVGHYGTAVYIEHADGYVTHYGHLSKIRVHVGQKVKARQLIAKSGSTGRSTGPHLHFTIQKNGVNKDPLKFIW